MKEGVLVTEINVEFSVVFKPKSNGFLGVIKVINNSQNTLENWNFHFNFIRRLEKVNISQGILKEQIGDYHIVAPLNVLALPPGESYIFECLYPDCRFEHLSDLPKGGFITIEANKKIKILQANILSKVDFPKTDFKSQQISDGFSPAKYGVIPKPNLFEVKKDKFKIEFPILMSESNCDFPELLTLLPEMENRIFKVAKEEKGRIHLLKNNLLGEEAYILDITKDQIKIQGGSQKGAFYGLITLWQYLGSIEGATPRKSIEIPLCHIQDAPEYSFRGFMLDVSRHFFSVSEIKKVLDFLALLKINYFHWHLTDDEGWRIEIDNYPELTKIGSKRGFGEKISPHCSGGSKTYGAFYSKKDINEIVSYAHKRGIEIIPEIDIPGHARAAIISLEELLKEKEDASEYISVQHYKDNILCPGLKETEIVLQAIFEEVCQLFPGKYIHIGGDEVPEGVWRNSPACQERIKSQGIYDVRSLYGELVESVRKLISSKGKTMLAWEEVAESEKVNSEAVLGIWTHPESARKVLKKGFSVVMCPGQYTYFDMVHSKHPLDAGFYWTEPITLEKAYSFEPREPHLISKKERNQVLGVQGNLWTELVDSFQKLEYMVFPRIFAISETAWTHPVNKDLNCFYKRVLNISNSIFKKKGISFRDPQSEVKGLYK